MASKLSGLYEITLVSAAVTPQFLSILWKEPRTNVVLLDSGFENAAQIWQVRTLDNGAITIRNLKYNLYVSYHGAHQNSPLIATREPREWIPQQGAGKSGVLLKASDTEDLYASLALIKPWPPQTALLPKHEELEQTWKFHRILLEGESD